MTAEKEARRSLQAGRATHRRRYTGSVPQAERDRTCAGWAAMVAALFLLMFAVETFVK